jgi:hypothetical protein
VRWDLSIESRKLSAGDPKISGGDRKFEILNWIYVLRWIKQLKE